MSISQINRLSASLQEFTSVDQAEPKAKGAFTDLEEARFCSSLQGQLLMA